MLTIHFEDDDLTLEQISARRQLRLLDEFETVADLIDRNDAEVLLSAEELRSLYIGTIGVKPSDRHAVRRQLYEQLEGTVQ